MRERCERKKKEKKCNSAIVYSFSFQNIILYTPYIHKPKLNKFIFLFCFSFSIELRKSNAKQFLFWIFFSYLQLFLCVLIFSIKQIEFNSLKLCVLSNAIYHLHEVWFEWNFALIKSFNGTLFLITFQSKKSKLSNWHSNIDQTEMKQWILFPSRTESSF